MLSLTNKQNERFLNWTYKSRPKISSTFQWQIIFCFIFDRSTKSNTKTTITSALNKQKWVRVAYALQLYHFHLTDFLLSFFLLLINKLLKILYKCFSAQVNKYGKYALFRNRLHTNFIHSIFFFFFFSTLIDIKKDQMVSWSVIS